MSVVGEMLVRGVHNTIASVFPSFSTKCLAVINHLCQECIVVLFHVRSAPLNYFNSIFYLTEMIVMELHVELRIFSVNVVFNAVLREYNSG